MTNVYVGRNGESLQIPSSLFLVLCNRSLACRQNKLHPFSCGYGQISHIVLTTAARAACISVTFILRSIGHSILSSHLETPTEAALL